MYAVGTAYVIRMEFGMWCVGEWSVAELSLSRGIEFVGVFDDMVRS